MISVEFKSVGTGTCSWCDKEKDEVFDVVFSDKSFVGLYCRGDLMKAVSVKCEKRTVARAAVVVSACDPKTAAHTNGGGYGQGSSTTGSAISDKPSSTSGSQVK